MVTVIIFCRKRFSEEKWPRFTNIGVIEPTTGGLSEVTHKAVFTIRGFISQLPMQ